MTFERLPGENWNFEQQGQKISESPAENKNVVFEHLHFHTIKIFDVQVRDDGKWKITKIHFPQD